jgi:hypothetical protein
VSRAGRSVLAFGIYLIGLGALLAVAPNVVTRIVGIAETDEPWLRLLGALAINVGGYYVTAAIRGLRPIIVASVVARTAIPVWLLAFVAFADADPRVMIFGAADLAGATWTGFELLRERAGSALPGAA